MISDVFGDACGDLDHYMNEEYVNTHTRLGQSVLLTRHLMWYAMCHQQSIDPEAWDTWVKEHVTQAVESWRNGTLTLEGIPTVENFDHSTMPEQRLPTDADEKVTVNATALRAVVDYLLHEESKDFDGETDHIYLSLLPLAESCGFIESASDTLAQWHEEHDEE